jgi:hypothetical protein
LIVASQRRCAAVHELLPTYADGRVSMDEVCVYEVVDGREDR